MKALDFEYDGQLLSDYGFIVCNFDDASGVTEAVQGAAITFSTVSLNGGKKYNKTGATYEECLSTTFDICKNPEVYTSQSEMEITKEEFRDIARWLNRKEFLRFRIVEDNAVDLSASTCYFDASFNITKILISETLYGIRLNMQTNRPFGYGREISTTWSIESNDTTKSLYDRSGEIGYLSPKIEITLPNTLTETATITIKNELAGEQICCTQIENCSAGETITIDGETQIITSSKSDHKIYDDFNYDFFIIGNTFSNSENKITISSPCKIKISYCPVIKDVP